MRFQPVREKKPLNTLMSVVLVFAMLLCSIPMAIATPTLIDTEGHWAKDTIREMADKGIITGYSDGTFKPDKEITRAEFVSLLVKAISLEPGPGKVFSDTAGHWAKDAISTANYHGLVTGDNDAVFRPDDPITREEIAVIVVRAIKAGPTENGKAFADSSQIASWAKDAVEKASAVGLVAGYSDGTFRPKANTTRAEAAVILERSMKLVEEEPAKTVFDTAGTYGPQTGTQTVDADVTINADGVILQNTIVKGNLIISEKVGDGNVTLNNVTVEGTTFIRGGGENSIRINGGRYNNMVIENTPSKNIRIIAANAEITNVIVSENAKGEKIILEGTFEAIEIRADNTALSIQGETIIDEIKVKENISGASIDIDKNTTVKELVLNSVASVNNAKDTVKKISGQKASDSNIVYRPETGTSTGGGGGGGTAAKPTVTGIAIKTPPNKTDYAEGDKLDLTGLVVTLTKSDSSTQDVSLSDFKSKGITTSPANGEVLTAETAEVVIAVNGITVTQPINVVVPSAKEVELQILIDKISEEEVLVWACVSDPSSESEMMVGLTKDNFSLSDALGHPVEFNFNDPELRELYPDVPEHEYLISPAEGVFAGTYILKFSKAGYITVSKEFAIGAFAPGEGGALPAFTSFEPKPNTIAGLCVYKSHRRPSYFSGGNHSVVELNFPAPLSFGAESYTLQYSDNNGETWQDYPGFTTSSAEQNNFSIESPGGNYQYRLLVKGGPKNGYTSNVVEAPLTSVDTYFSGWSLDESMFISGTILPWVGRGLQASFTVKKLEDNTEVDSSYLSYQWYRVNPATYEMTEIDGATDLTYITTEDDVGYELLIRATGDEENIGGFIQILSSSITMLPNKAFATNITESGFTLNLYKSVDNLTKDDLVLNDADGNLVPIISVTPVGSSKAVFNIEADMSANKGPFYLRNESDFWNIASEEHGHMLMPHLEIFFSTGADKSALQATIYAALELDEEEYTKDSWQAFTEALVAAQAVLADEDATQDDVDAVLEALSAAMEGLLEAVIPL